MERERESFFFYIYIFYFLHNGTREEPQTTTMTVESMPTLLNYQYIGGERALYGHPVWLNEGNLKI